MYSAPVTYISGGSASPSGTWLRAGSQEVIVAPSSTPSSTYTRAPSALEHEGLQGAQHLSSHRPQPVAHTPPRTGHTKWARHYDADIFTPTPMEGDEDGLDPPQLLVSDATSARYDRYDPRRQKARTAYHAFPKGVSKGLNIEEFVKLVHRLGGSTDRAYAAQIYPAWQANEGHLMPDNDFVQVYTAYF
eukprot:GGOE01036311.1.p2 GENE.GGOE01036311.1~~GGOE01036311.1.p2  ORF type:complete len:201 (+),score=37.01 GGOE01036311.1:37-603(+)